MYIGYQWVIGRLKWHCDDFARYCKYIWHKITCKPERCLKGWKVLVFLKRHGPRKSTTLRPLRHPLSHSGMCKIYEADLSWPRTNLSCWKSWKKPDLAHSNWEEKRCTRRIREISWEGIADHASCQTFQPRQVFTVLRHVQLGLEWKTNLALA